MNKWLKRLGLAAGVPLYLAGLMAAYRVSPELEYEPSLEEFAQVLEGSSLRIENGIPVLTVDGNPYQQGYQQGYYVRDSAKENLENMLNYVYDYNEIFGLPVPEFVSNWILDYTYNRLEISDENKQEMQGLADALEVDIQNVKRLHTLPVLMPNACSSFAAWGIATRDGKLIQHRNLDWIFDIGIQTHPLIVEHENYVNIGFTGFVGVLAGMNSDQITVAQIGAESKASEWSGQPMPFILKDILEHAKNLKDAEKRLKSTKRCNGHNYVIGSGKENKALAFETNSDDVIVFRDHDLKEFRSEYGLPMYFTIFRGDTAFSEKVRKTQTCANGFPNSPKGSNSYEQRYKKMSGMAKKDYMVITLDTMIKIAQETAIENACILSVIYHPSTLEYWVSYATNEEIATDTEFHHFLFSPNHN